MTPRPVRSEWVESAVIPLSGEDDSATMADFGFAQTRDLLAVEPRLLTLASLVQGCARGAGVTPDLWPGIEALASALLGPGRSATQSSPISAMSRAVSPSLRGETVRRRYLAALHNIARDNVTAVEE